MLDSRPQILALCLLGVVLCCAGGCAASYPGPGEGGVKSAVPLPGDTRLSGVWMFRHKVRLEIAARKVAVSFDGVMRLDAEARRIRVTALAGVGLRMFDMEVEPDAMRVVYLHPSLRKIPRVTEHIAESIRRIWFDCLLQMPHIGSGFSHSSGSGWSITCTPNDVPGDGSGDAPGTALWPETTRLADGRAGYVLTVRLLRAQREDTP